jgi:hypothetical protein
MGKYGEYIFLLWYNHFINSNSIKCFFKYYLGGVFLKKAIILLSIFLLLFASGCRTREYSVEKAVSNGEVVFDYDTTYNVKRLDKFVENVNNKIPDKVKISQYGDEGMFLIETISYDGKTIKAEFNSTMDFHPNERKKEVKEYSAIVKAKCYAKESDINYFTYYLINRDEKIGIFMTPEGNTWKRP